MNIINVLDVSYEADNKKIVTDVSFRVDEKDSFALLGANGAGKSTLIDIILGDLKPTKGDVTFFDQKRRDYKNVGVSYDHFYLFPLLKVKELFKYFCVLYKLNFKEVKNQHFSLFGLDKIEDTYIKKLSQGERKKVSILLSIMSNPKLVILDEPFANLDPTIIESIWKEIKKNNRTIVFSSHNWDIVEQIADKVCFIKNGKVLHSPDSPKVILDKLPSDRKVVVNNTEAISDFLKHNNYPHYIHEGNTHIFLNENSVDLEDFLKKDNTTNEFSFERTKLKDVYLYL